MRNEEHGRARLQTETEEKIMNRKVFSLMMALAMVLTLLPAQSLAVGETRPEVQFV